MTIYSRPVLALCCASIALGLARRAPRRRLAAAFASIAGANGTATLALPAPLGALRTPCAIVRRSIVERNCAAMLARAAALGVALRPHVKTHKTVEGALLQTGGRRGRITVSTIAEAEWFAARGFDDILYAVPITPDKLGAAAALLRAGVRLHVCVDHDAQLDAIVARARADAASFAWSVVLMVDCGYHRDGVDPESELALRLARRCADARGVELFGVYTHGGHSYDAASPSAIRRIAAAERDAVVGLAARVRAALPEVGALPSVGVGSTPTAALPAEHLEGVTELHPGNYLFFDTTQASLGACDRDREVACRVLTRVVGHYARSNTLLVDLGWTGCSAQGKERGYGALVGEPNLKIVNLKQEAGEITTVDGAPIDYAHYPIGSFLELLPHHSCAAAHQHASLFVVDDDDRVVAEWQRARGW